MGWAASGRARRRKGPAVGSGPGLELGQPRQNAGTVLTKKNFIGLTKKNLSSVEMGLPEITRTVFASSESRGLHSLVCKKERKKTDNPREGWVDVSHARDFFLCFAQVLLLCHDSALPPW